MKTRTHFLIALTILLGWPVLVAAVEIEPLLVIEPGKDNPRNSEGDIIELVDGRLCLIYTRFTGGSGDNAAADLAMRTSKDDGKSWSKDSIVVHHPGGLNVMSVSLLRLANGKIALFYLRKTSRKDCRPMMCISTDEAQSWSEPTLCITDKVGYYVLNNDRAVQLQSGRLILPVAWHQGPGEPRDTAGVIMCYLSDDDGKTWRRSKDSFKGYAPDGRRIIVQEPGVVELRDGSLMMYMRTNAGSQYICSSHDGGETWSKARPSSLASPLSPASVKRIPWTGDLLCVWNDHSGIHAYTKGRRTPLCLAVSQDEGKTWSRSRIIEDNPDGWYCYTAITFAKDRVLLAYCAGDKKIGGLNRLKVVALSRDWLTSYSSERNTSVDSCFNKDGFLQIDGVSRLIIGLYELPEDDEKLLEVAESGFNLVRSPQDIKALGRIGKHGLYAWINLGSAAQLRKADHDSEQKLTKIINKFKDQSSLLVWELPDEALWNIWWSRFNWVFGGQQQELRKHIEGAGNTRINLDTAKFMSLLKKANDYNNRGLWKKAEEIYDSMWSQLQAKNPHPNWKMSQCPDQENELTDAIARGCRVIKHLDSKHPIWQNHAPRNSVRSMAKYNRPIDAVGCDIYPVPFNPTSGHSDLKDTNLSAVGAYTDRMREAAPGKSIWMVLQGFGWRDLSEEAREDADPQRGRRPNISETRFMAYDAIVHGANAILYWGTHAIEKDSLLWQNLMKIAKELRALEPGIVGERPVNEPASEADETYGSIDGQGPCLMLRKTRQDWILIAVNEHSQSISFTVSRLPDELEGKTLYRLHSDESYKVKKGAFHDGIRGFGVHVYATSRRLYPFRDKS